MPNENEIDSRNYVIFSNAIEQLHFSTKENYHKAKAELNFISQMGFNINKIYFGGFYGNTSLMWEISYGKAIKPDGALIMLHMFNADPFIPDNNGKNALHFLLLKGHDIQRCIVDEILDHRDINTHINDVTVYGDTCLHIACIRRDEKYIVQLLEKGADLNIKNRKGQTPIDMLYLTEKERLELLSDSKYLKFASDLDYVATIIKESFNSDPQSLENKIKKHGKETNKQLCPSLLSDSSSHEPCSRLPNPNNATYSNQQQIFFKSFEKNNTHRFVNSDECSSLSVAKLAK